MLFSKFLMVSSPAKIFFERKQRKMEAILFRKKPLFYFMLITLFFATLSLEQDYVLSVTEDSESINRDVNLEEGIFPNHDECKDKEGNIEESFKEENTAATLSKETEVNEVENLEEEAEFSTNTSMKLPSEKMVKAYKETEDSESIKTVARDVNLEEGVFPNRDECKDKEGNIEESLKEEKINEALNLEEETGQNFEEAQGDNDKFVNAPEEFEGNLDEWAMTNKESEDILTAGHKKSLSNNSISKMKKSITGDHDFKPYVVYLGAHTHGVEPTTADLDRVSDSHHHLLGSYLGSKEKAKERIFHSLKREINGFFATLNEEEAAALSNHPDVVSIFLNQKRALQTTRSWQFLGLEDKNGDIPSGSLWKKARFGEDVIIANLDTGVWPEAKSFSDEGMGPIPSRWRGICQQGINEGIQCNRKLIGVRYFNTGLAASIGKVNSTFQTARDHDGHGTHTLSTAGGNFVGGANVFGHGNGTAKGGSPKARVAAYKVCWPEVGCNDVDILAGLDAAISDGVDVISLSISEKLMPGTQAEGTLFECAISIGAFHAASKGIVVVGCAGNEGPSPSKIANDFPWLITVGASTIDRQFVSYVSLGRKTPHGKNTHIKGLLNLSSGSLPSQKFYPLIYGAAAKNDNNFERNAEWCWPGALNYTKIKGKILVCQGKFIEPVEKSYEAARGGAVGMILVLSKKTLQSLTPVLHFLPTSSILSSDGQTLFSYINSTQNPVAYITHVRTELNKKPAPVMASFSSRGPSKLVPSILKPDIIAPGVSIIAAFSEDAPPTGNDYDKRRIPFHSIAGTSMSCPHISGIAGLLRSLHPEWSPAAIRSALMTTASIRSNNDHQLIKDFDNTIATPFAYGAGHVRPNRAMNPGLIYDLNLKDYLNFLCAIGYNGTKLRSFTTEPYSCPKSFELHHFNYPSISIPLLNGTATVMRRLKNVGPPATYKASVKAPQGISVSVSPSTLKFKKIGQEKRFKVVLKSRSSTKHRKHLYGWLTWSGGKRRVRSPITVTQV